MRRDQFVAGPQRRTVQQGPDKAFRRLPAEACARLVNGGERRDEVPGEIDIVEPDHAHVSGDAKPQPVAFRDEAEGAFVRGREHGGGPFRHIGPDMRGRGTGRDGEAAVVHHGRKLSRRHRRLESGLPRVTQYVLRGAGHVQDVPVSEIREMIHGDARCGTVVNTQSWQRVTVVPLAKLHDGQGPVSDHVRRQRPVEQQDPVGAPALDNGLEHLGSGAAVRDLHRESRLPRDVLNGCDDPAEKGICQVRRQNQDRAWLLHPQVARRAVDPVPRRENGRHDPFPGFRTDDARRRQRPADGGRRHARGGGDVCDTDAVAHRFPFAALGAR